MSIWKFLKKALFVTLVIMVVGIGGIIFLGRMLHSGHDDNSNNRGKNPQISNESGKDAKNTEKELGVKSNIDALRDAMKAFNDVNDNDLVEQISSYILEHPEKRELFVKYIMSTKLIQFRTDKREKENSDQRDGAFLFINTIPIMGGMITDALYELVVEQHKNALLTVIGDNTIPKYVADKKHSENILSDHAYNVFLEAYCLPMDKDDCDTMVKIATLISRKFEAAIEDNKVRMSMDFDVFDFYDYLSYDLFSKEETRNKYRSANESIQKIYALFDIKKAYTSKAEIISYYEAKIPRHMFPYDIEETFFPTSKDEMLLDINYNKKERLKIYPLLNGKWRSVITGQIVEMYINPEQEGKLYKYPKLNYVYFVSKNGQFAHFNYDDSSGDLQFVFITPASFFENGAFHDVLMMYVKPQMVNIQGVDDRHSMKQVNCFHVYNVRSADDVLVKEG